VTSSNHLAEPSDSLATFGEYALSGDGHSIALTALTGTAPNQVANVFIVPTDL
jgi:hypothetical protein